MESPAVTHSVVAVAAERSLPRQRQSKLFTTASRGSRDRMRSPFKYFNSSPEVICLAVTMYVRYLLSPRNVEDLLSEREIDICHKTVRLWWNRFGLMLAA